jgi:hypothetical protein
MSHLNQKIGKLAKQIFTNWMLSQGKELQVTQSGLLVHGKSAYRVSAKVSTKLHNHDHCVTGINEERLEKFASKCNQVFRTGFLVFIDCMSRQMKMISVEDWYNGFEFIGLKYPVTHLSHVGGRISYSESSHIPTVYELSKEEADKLRSLTILNKSNKGQIVMFT